MVAGGKSGVEVVTKIRSRPAVSAPSASSVWRKAQASTANANCVEVAFFTGGRVGVRDSKNRSKPSLDVSAHAWASFLADLKAGQFDLDV
jgi:hypothetical protein